MRITAAAFILCLAAIVSAQSPAPAVPADTLLGRAVLTALDDELSCVPKDHVSPLTRLHRDCHRFAVEKRGAAGLISYNSNQVSAWWRDDQDLIRRGHLDARGRRNAFAIMARAGAVSFKR